jgi:hypothetical protein
MAERPSPRSGAKEYASAETPARWCERHRQLPSQGIPVRGQIGDPLLSVLQLHIGDRLLGLRVSDQAKDVETKQCCNTKTFCQSPFCLSTARPRNSFNYRSSNAEKRHNTLCRKMMRHGPYRHIVGILLPRSPPP